MQSLIDSVPENGHRIWLRGGLWLQTDIVYKQRHIVTIMYYVCDNVPMILELQPQMRADYCMLLAFLGTRESKKAVTGRLCVSRTAHQRGTPHRTGAHAPVAPARSHFGRCGGLVSSESWPLYDSVPMTGNLVLFR